jgi:putative hydrolase of the HAD superfamily
VLQELQLAVEPERVWQAHQEADRVFGPQIYDFVGRMKGFWTMFDRFILSKLGIADPGDRLARAIADTFEKLDLLQTFPETRSALEGLRQRGYRLGIISNAIDDLLVHLDRLDLIKFFDSITLSQEARAEKPDPAIFRLALERARCAPYEAVHVGNDYECDVVGARGVGITPVLIDRDDRYPRADCLRIRNLTELRPLLDRL